MSALEGYGLVVGANADPNIAIETLKSEVLRRMAQGWIPQGGICHVIAPASPDAVHIFSQAIVKPAQATQDGIVNT